MALGWPGSRASTCRGRLLWVKVLLLLLLLLPILPVPLPLKPPTMPSRQFTVAGTTLGTPNIKSLVDPVPSLISSACSASLEANICLPDVHLVRSLWLQWVGCNVRGLLA